jgi:hypothetical protein
MKLLLSLTTAALFAASVSALSFDELHTLPALTPETFGSYFSGFKFVFRADVQRPDDFLSTQAGDCDDFSTLAATELAARGYTPRLISVRMKKEVHVVCYIAEANGYLDYNFRNSASALIPCGPELSQIAASVTKSFKGATWTSTSEFTYHGEGVKRLVKTTLAKDLMASSH